jgi:hypothetical protein
VAGLVLRGCRRNSEQVRVGAQDPLLECAQLRPWVDAKLVGELPPGLLVDLERVGLPAGPVQREHELAAQPLA